MVTIVKRILIFLILLSGFCLSIGISYILVYFQSRTFPNTFLGSTDISKKTEPEIRSVISSLNASTIQLSMKDRTYEYTLPMIGISIDEEKIIALIFTRNRASFIPYVQNLHSSLQTKLSITPELLTLSGFDEFTATIHELSDASDGLTLDQTGTRFVIVRNEERYTIDPISFKQELMEHITDPSYVYQPKLIAAPSTKARDAHEYNTLLARIYSTPMNVTITDGLVNQSIVIPSDSIKTTFLTHYNSTTGMIGFSVKDPEFSSLIKPLYAQIKLSPDVQVMDADAKRLLADAMTKRALGNPTAGAILGATIGPNTDGSRAYKYIEVDISQQRMYLFQNGSMIASFRVSTGKYLPTPTGEFSILNKAASGAYSNIWHVYMPFWMAFYYKDAYYGIHELPYYYSPDGKKIQRPREFIGSPNTGGCVALDIGDAEKVFNFGHVGMKVIIYE